MRVSPSVRAPGSRLRETLRVGVADGSRHRVTSGAEPYRDRRSRPCCETLKINTSGPLNPPGLSAADRKTCPVTDVVVSPHADEHRRPLWLPLENPSGVIAPTQSGKSRRDLIHKILAAPGGMVVSTTKPDLFLWTAMTAHRRGVPVLLFDVTGSLDWPAQVRWSPVTGCADPILAMRRAK